MAFLKKLYFLIVYERNIRLSLSKVKIVKVLSILSPVLNFLSIFNVIVLILLLSLEGGYFNSRSFRIKDKSLLISYLNV